MSRRLSFLSLALFFLSCTTEPVDSVLGPEFAIVSVGPETQVTTDPSDQFDPSISGPLVVYSDRSGADADTWVHDLTTGVAMSITDILPGDQLLNDVSGNLVVFTDFGAGNANIWACEWDGAACPATQVTDHPANQRRPAVFGSLIVYEDDRSGNYDLYLVDLTVGTEVQITNSESHERKAAIFGTRVVWEDFRNGNADVYTCEWNGTACVNEQAVTNDIAQDVDPDIFGDWVVFGTNRASIGDIYAVNITEGSMPIPVTSGDYYERNPEVSGTYVSYESYASGDSDIRLYDLATGTDWQLTFDPAEQYLHALSGTRSVFTDNRNENLDIYMVELTEGDVSEVDNLHDAVDGFVDDGSITNHGIGNALHAFLDQIASALDNGNDAAACRRLEHFIRFVTNKSGKQIDASAAAELIAMAETLAAEYCGV